MSIPSPSLQDAEVPYLPYLQLDEPIHVLPRDMNDVDICSDPINVPGNLPFGDIRVPSLSVSTKKQPAISVTNMYFTTLTGVRKWSHFNKLYQTEVISLCV